ncbi:MAG: peptidylprolyl isomerase [Ignavibacteriaceae bacterium]
MKKFYFIIFFLLIISSSYKMFSQDQGDSVVAKAGNISITAKEFLDRYEMTPLFRKQITRMTPSLKLEFLYSLIAEKLWANQAEQMGFDTTSVMKFVTKQYEDMFVRDAVFRKDIKDKVKVTDKDILQGFMRSQTTLEVNYLVSNNKKEIFNLYKLLKDGIPFDTLLATRPEKIEQTEPKQIVYGQMAQSIEDTLYGMKVGSYTSPIFSPDGWYIFKMTNKIHSSENTATGQNNSVESVKKTVEAIKERKLYQEYFYNFFKDKKVEANAILLRSLAEKLSAIFSKRKFELRISHKDPVFMDVTDVQKLEQEFGPDSLAMPCIEFKTNPMTLDTFIRKLIFQGFSSYKTDYRSIGELINTVTRSMIEHALFAREGFKEKLNLLPSVQRDLKMWRENYLTQLLQNKFIDSSKISDSTVYDYYKKFNKNEYYPEEVNIVEVFNKDPDIIDEVLKEARDGVNMHNLAMKYTQREWTKKQNGEFGFFPITKFGKIGEIASTMKVGDIYGPLKLNDGYSVFELIGKRPSKVDTALPFEKSKEELSHYLAMKKEHKAITDYTVYLAKKFGVSIDMPLLESIKVTEVNAFGYRLLGFGGRIPAVPLMAPNVDWVDPYLKSLNITP